MKRGVLFFGMMFLLASCTYKDQDIIFEAKTSDLNGTWNRYNEGLTKEKIDEIREKSNNNLERRMEFSWGVGSFNPNGSWYFDIGGRKSLFFPDGHPMYQVLTTKNKDKNNIEVSIVSLDLYEKRSDEDLHMENYITTLNIKFYDTNHISISNPDKKLFIDGGVIELYRLSGPKMMFKGN